MCAVNGNPIECGNGTCIGGTCNCDDDYVNIDNFCEETCVLTPCQDSDLISVPIDRKRNLHELSTNNELEWLFDYSVPLDFDFWLTFLIDYLVLYTSIK